MLPNIEIAKQELDDDHDDKNSRESYVEDDRISQLPDPILVNILSLLTVREVTVMCAMSKRWRHLWEFIFVLNFDGSKLLNDIVLNEKPLDEQRSLYVNWVNKILEFHKGSTVNEFRIYFKLDSRYTNEINRWLDFAMSRRVQKLDVDLAGNGIGHRQRYTFSEELYNHLQTPLGLSCIESLTSLCLHFVNVTGDILEHFLSNCYFLERLVVEHSEPLVSLKVVGSSVLRLKHLEILHCRRFLEIEIFAPDLVSFGYHGPKMRLRIGDAPFLNHLFLGGVYGHNPAFAFPILSSYFCQLETLHLAFHLHDMDFPNIPELTSLKHLTISVCAQSYDSLLGIDSLIDAAPFLQQLTFKMMAFKGYTVAKRDIIIKKNPHQCLKIVEIVGFFGYKIEFEAAMYLCEKAIKLEKIILDRRECLEVGKPWELAETKSKKAATRNALQLKEKVPRGLELVII